MTIKKKNKLEYVTTAASPTIQPRGKPAKASASATKAPLALFLHEIRTIAQISEGKALRMMESCIWCWLACDHTNGSLLRVRHGKFSDEYSVAWPDSSIDREAIGRSYNQDDATEDGAEAIALLLSIERTEYTAVERASTTTGIDYWLGHKNAPLNLPFQRAGRLEISGILRESASNTIATRLKGKVSQTKPTDSTFPVYVIVVEFGQPIATMVLKNAKT
jgi:hypothetical protein